MKSLGLTLIITLTLILVGQALILPTNTIHSAYSKIQEEDSVKSFNRDERIVVHKDNWFDFVNEYFEKYTTAEVIDVGTLKSYRVKRVGGYNHADVEPLTPEDTATFYSIYNNNWSWTRRPVWVYYKGRFMAGSINGYPHSYDLVSDNNMSGHTCIHFYMSRTHGTNNLDPAHQNAVETALNSENKLNEYINS